MMVHFMNINERFVHTPAKQFIIHIVMNLKKKIKMLSEP